MKEKIIDGVKLFLCISMMFVGFYTTYAFVLFSLGVDLTNLVMWIVVALAGLSEFVYIEWLKG